MTSTLSLNCNRFYFLRHGQTEANRAQIFHADESIPITGKGQEQAERAADVLSQQPLSGLVSSPYFRVQQTVAPLLAQSTHLSNSHYRDLGERSFAGLDGRKFKDVVGREASDEAWREFWHQKHKGVETTDDFQVRIERGMSEALTQDDLLLAAHGGVLIAVVAALGLTIEGASHGNAHPKLFQRESAEAPWTGWLWDWDKATFERWC